MNKVQRVKLVLSVSLTSLFVAASYELRNALASIISINRGRLGRGAEDVLLKNQELMS